MWWAHFDQIVKELRIYPVGNVRVNCPKTLNKPSMGPPGMTPSAPSVGTLADMKSLPMKGGDNTSGSHRALWKQPTRNKPNSSGDRYDDLEIRETSGFFQASTVVHPNPKPSKSFKSTPRELSSRLNQTLTGHGYTGEYC